jgi:DNA primase
LHQAREAIRDTKTIVAVEGYTDCISAHQAGLTNAVATCGTALTDMHVTTMKRFARKIVLIFDGDDAGVDAAEKSVARFLAQDADLRILTLPAGKDPADFLAEHSADFLREQADAAPEAWNYKFESVRKRFGNAVDARQRILEEMLAILAVVPNMAEHVRESVLLGNLASRLAISETMVRERYREIREKAAKSVHVAVQDEPAAETRSDVMRILSGQTVLDDRLECELLEVVFAKPELARHVADEVPPDAVRNQALRTLLSTCYFILGKQEEPTFERVMNALEDRDLKRLAVWIDDQVRAKELERKLHDSEETRDGCPHFLRRTIENFKWRREEQSHGQAVVELSVNRDGAQRMDAAAEALLRQHTEFHQKRATKKAPA